MFETHLKSYETQTWTAQRPHGFVSSMRPPSAEVAKRLPRSIRWSLLLFAFSLPYEQIDVGILSGSLSFSKIASVLVMASCLLHGRFTFSRIHPALFCFGGYVMVLYFRGLLDFGQWFGGATFLTRLQLVLLAWVISTPLKDQKLAKQALITFCIGCMLVSVGMILGLPGFAQSYSTNGVERVMSEGSDPNFLGTMLAFAMVIVVGLFLGKGILTLRNKFCLGSLSLLLPTGLLLTQSRTAVVCLIIGVVLYILPIGRITSVLKKVPVVICCLAALLIFIATNPAILSRLSSTYYEGNVSTRDKIVVNSFNMIAEKPILGWGPDYRAVLGADTHNLYLYLLMEVGLVGTVPFVLGLVLCFNSVWRSRNSEWGKVCFVVFLTLLLANVALNWSSFKTMWFLIAVAALSGTVRNRNSGPRTAIRLMRWNSNSEGLQRGKGLFGRPGLTNCKL